MTGITKLLICNTTRAGVERGELDRVALPGGQQGFKVRYLKRARQNALKAEAAPRYRAVGVVG